MILPGEDIKIFVDMDDVLTAFTATVTRLGHAAGLPYEAPFEAKEAMYKAIDEAGIPFWAGMPWTPGGKHVWEIVNQYCQTPVLLSSPGYMRYAPAGKNLWVKFNLPGVPLFLSTTKSEYAERDAILIDDSRDNIGAWKECGGLGILYEGDPARMHQQLHSLFRTA